MSAWIPSRFLPQLKEMQVSLTGDSKLPLGAKESSTYCQCLKCAQIGDVNLAQVLNSAPLLNHIAGHTTKENEFAISTCNESNSNFMHPSCMSVYVKLKVIRRYITGRPTQA